MKKLFLIFVTLTYFYPTPIHAKVSLPESGSGGNIDIRTQIEARNPNYPDLNPGGDALGTIASNGVQAVMAVSGIAAFLYLLWGGVNWLMAGGDKTKVEAARDRITNAIVGLAIIASVWVIYGIIDGFFGIGNYSG